MHVHRAVIYDHFSLLFSKVLFMLVFMIKMYSRRQNKKDETLEEAQLYAYSPEPLNLHSE